MFRVPVETMADEYFEEKVENTSEVKLFGKWSFIPLPSWLLVSGCDVERSLYSRASVAGGKTFLTVFVREQGWWLASDV